MISGVFLETFLSTTCSRTTNVTCASRNRLRPFLANPCLAIVLKPILANQIVINPFSTKINVLVVSQSVRPRRVGVPKGGPRILGAPKGGAPEG